MSESGRNASPDAVGAADNGSAGSQPSPGGPFPAPESNASTPPMSNASMDGTGPGSRRWLRAARAIERRVALARWIARYVPWFVGINLAAGPLWLGARMLGLHPAIAAAAYAAALLAAAAVCALPSRRCRFTTTDGLVRLDTVLGLESRLTSAADGIGRWPAPRGDHIDDGLRWEWRRIALGPVVSAAVFAVVASIPLSREAGGATGQIREPVAWGEMESWIEDLREEEAIDEEALREWEERIEALRDRPTAEWYTHGSLEASDTLREQLTGALRELDRELSAAGSALDETARQPVLDAEAWGKLSERLAEATGALELGGLPLTEELLAQLSELAAGELMRLTPEQLEELLKRLSECQGACQGCLGTCIGEGDALCLAAAQTPGRGGINRGRGDAPLGLAPEPTDLGTTQTETLPTASLDNAALGDLVGVGTARPETDLSGPATPTAGGAIATTGSGGDAVWKTTLTPRERRVLQRYFQ